MSYYKDKRQCIAKIDAMIRDGKTDSQIAYVIGQLYGFGMRIVKERRDIIEAMQDVSQ